MAAREDAPAAHVERAAREAGLDRLLEQEPQLLERAHDLARGYAARLARPDAPEAEPAHQYRLTATPPGGSDRR